MKALIEYLARSLVDNPAPVEVFEDSSPDGVTFRLKVSRDDLGKVIGKKGRTAKALRTLLAAAGAKQNLRVTLEILEPSGGVAPGASMGAGDEGGRSPAPESSDAVAKSQDDMASE